MTRRSSHDTESEEHLRPVDFRIPTAEDLANAKAEWPLSAMLALVLVAAGGMFGWALVFSAAKVLADQQKGAIDHGAARYHPTTGKFEWLSHPDGKAE